MQMLLILLQKETKSEGNMRLISMRVKLADPRMTWVFLGVKEKPAGDKIVLHFH